jgi:hypothetical protein
MSPKECNDLQRQAALSAVETIQKLRYTVLTLEETIMDLKKYIVESDKMIKMQNEALRHWTHPSSSPVADRPPSTSASVSRSTSPQPQNFQPLQGNNTVNHQVAMDVYFRAMQDRRHATQHGRQEQQNPSAESLIKSFFTCCLPGRNNSVAPSRSEY